MLSKEDVGAIQTFYSLDLPDLSSFVGEVEKWEAKVKRDNLHVGKQSVLSTMAIADAEFFPNIHEIMKLILTIPVGSVPCERSFSAMRRLKDWSRSSMTENRLCGLALLYTHRDMEVNLDNVLARFDACRHRRIGSLS